MKYKYQEIQTQISEGEAHDLIERIANFIVSRHMAPAGIMLIESLHPLHSIGSQAMYFLLPFAESFLTAKNTSALLSSIQKEEYIKLLVKRIDELDEELNRERRAAARLRSKRRNHQIRAFFGRIFNNKNKNKAE